MNNPKVSVLISTFNNSKYLEKSIESILDQTYKNLEILVSDDNSTDNSVAILKKMQQKNSNLKIYKNSVNQGLTKSLNKLIRVAEGEIISRHDTDDISFRTKIQTQLDFLQNKNLDFCTSRALVMNSEKKIPGYSFYLPNNILIKFKNPFIHGTLLIKKNVLEEIGGYNEKFIYAQDYDLFSRLIKSGYKYDVVKEPLYLLNTKDNISSLKKKEQSYYAECVRKNKNPELN
jgi:glycosyltransferase involved in cell wall biosynthesis